MPKSYNQKMKLLYLMKIFMDNTDEEHPMTLKEITDRLLDVGITAERKSLYSDIEYLRAFGVDIVAVRGKHYGYYVASRQFELPELKLLADAVLASKFITEKKSRQLIEKIKTLTGRHEAEQLQRQVYTANRIKNENESIYYNVDKIHTAIQSDRRIKFKYFEWTHTKEKRLKRNGEYYCVSPWTMTWDNENYYLIAYDSESGIIKHYRVDKMLDIRFSDLPRDGKQAFKSFDMTEYSKQVFSMFGGEYEHVEMLCKNEYAGVIIDRFGINVNMFRADDNHFRIVEKVAISPQFLSWVFGLSDGVRILSPQRVADRFAEMASNIIKEYKK